MLEQVEEYAFYLIVSMRKCFLIHYVSYKWGPDDDNLDHVSFQIIFKLGSMVKFSHILWVRIGKKIVGFYKFLETCEKAVI